MRKQFSNRRLKTESEQSTYQSLKKSSLSRKLFPDSDQVQLIRKPLIISILKGSTIQLPELSKTQTLMELSQKKVQQTLSQRSLRSTNMKFSKKLYSDVEHMDDFSPTSPQTLDQTHLNQFKNIYKTSQANIVYIQEDIDRFLLNKNKKYDDPVFLIQSLLRGLSESVYKLKVMALDMNNYKNEKNNMEKAISDLSLEVPNLKNNNIQIMTYIIFAKVLQLYKSNQQAIILYKRAKRLAIGEAYYHQKMKCYRGLGEIMLQLRPQLAQLYLTKFLVSAWRLQSKSDELKAYELLGKYFYYTGNMDKASMFHKRMMEGLYEPENSGARKLAISKLTNGGRGSRANTVFEIEEDAYYNVSSDDEIQEIIFLREYQEDQLIQQSMFAKFRLQYHILRGVPKFDARTNTRQVQNEQTISNQNIRQKRFTQKMGDYKKSLTRPNQTLGEIKDVVLMSHLSPSRQLGIYQTMESKRPCHSRFQNKFLNSYNDIWELQRVSKYLQKYITMLQFMAQWLDRMESKFKIDKDKPRLESSESPNRRKGYLVK